MTPPAPPHGDAAAMSGKQQFRDVRFAGLAGATRAQLLVLMDYRNVDRGELARRLGVSRAHVSRLLSPSANLTINTILRITRALNAIVMIDMQASPTPKKTGE